MLTNFLKRDFLQEREAKNLQKVQPRFDLVYIFCRRFQEAEALVRGSCVTPPERALRSKDSRPLRDS